MPEAKNNNTNIYYEVEGEGPPLVLHHGFAGSLEDWREFGYTDSLKSEYQLIMLDARGHGKSDKPHDPRAYSIENRVKDVIAVLDDVKADTAHFLVTHMVEDSPLNWRCIPRREWNHSSYRGLEREDRILIFYKTG